MFRRDFLKAVAAGPIAATAARANPDVDLARLKDVRVTKITGFTHVAKRHKYVGKNSRLDDHGDTATDRVLRIATNQGIEGIGVGNPKPEAARELVGKTLDTFWKPGVGVVSPLGRADHALYDLAGKALGVPTWKLFGGTGPEWVPIYDGSIYFNDLLPAHPEAGEGVPRILGEIEKSLKAGHRAFKIKVGRGAKWMEKDAGFRRDVEVVQSIRKLAGPDVKLLVDGNNGFDLDGAKRWHDAVGDDLFWAEEMFPEQVDQDIQFREHLRSKGWKTLVADGESARDVEHFAPYIEAGALDVVQPDIRAFGFTLQWAMSRALEPRPSMTLAPHNWGSFLGLYMQAILARGLKNVLICEMDTSSSDLFETDAYAFKDGKLRVPDAPGCGLSLREGVFDARYRAGAWSES